MVGRIVYRTVDHRRFTFQQLKSFILIISTYPFMKKLSLLFLTFVAIAFAGCSSDDDDKVTLISNFEGKLSATNSEFKAVESVAELNKTYSTTFQDNDKAITFDHSYSDWGYGYSFSQFTYTNKSDNAAANSITAVTKKGKVGTTYLSAYAPVDDYTPAATFSIAQPEFYKMKGVWVTNSTYAYNGMTVGDGYAQPFKKGSWYKLTATGMTSGGSTVGTAEIYLANYSSDNDKPVGDWIWFDLSTLSDATKFKFTLTSTDNDPVWGMRTAAYFCMDAITLEEK